jgi:hypothetical protein
MRLLLPQRSLKHTLRRSCKSHALAHPPGIVERKGVQGIGEGLHIYPTPRPPHAPMFLRFVSSPLVQGAGAEMERETLVVVGAEVLFLALCSWVLLTLSRVAKASQGPCAAALLLVITLTVVEVSYTPLRPLLPPKSDDRGLPNSDLHHHGIFVQQVTFTTE